MFLKNRKIIFKMKISKVTDYAALTDHKKKLKYRQIKKLLASSLSDVVFIMLINVKMPTIFGILTFMSRINFVLSWVEHGKSFITSGPGFIRSQLKSVEQKYKWITVQSLCNTMFWSIGMGSAFGLILYVPVNNFFTYVRTGLPGQNQY